VAPLSDYDGIIHKMSIDALVIPLRSWGTQLGDRADQPHQISAHSRRRKKRESARKLELMSSRIAMSIQKERK
jgi:hypothetical protein